MDNKSAQVRLDFPVYQNGKIYGENYREGASTYEVFKNRKNILLDALGALSTPLAKNLYEINSGHIDLTDVSIRRSDVVQVNLDASLGPTQRVFVDLGPNGEVTLNGKAQEIIYSIDPLVLSWYTGTSKAVTFKAYRDGREIQVTDWTFSATSDLITVSNPGVWAPSTPYIYANLTEGEAILKVTYSDFGSVQTFDVVITLTQASPITFEIDPIDIAPGESGVIYFKALWEGEELTGDFNPSSGLQADNVYVIGGSGRTAYDDKKQRWATPIVAKNKEGTGWVRISLNGMDGRKGEIKVDVPVAYRYLTVEEDPYGELKGGVRSQIHFLLKLNGEPIDQSKVTMGEIEYYATPLPGDSRYLSLLASYSTYPIVDKTVIGAYYLSFYTTHIGCTLTWAVNCKVNGVNYRAVSPSTAKVNPAPVLMKDLVITATPGGVHGNQATFRLTQVSGGNANRAFEVWGWGSLDVTGATSYSPIYSTDTPGDYQFSFTGTEVNVKTKATVNENPGLATKAWDLDLNFAP